MLSLVISKMSILHNVLGYIGRNSLVYFTCECAIAGTILSVVTSVCNIRIPNDTVTWGMLIVFIKFTLITPFVPIIMKLLYFIKQGCKSIEERICC